MFALAFEWDRDGSLEGWMEEGFSSVESLSINPNNFKPSLPWGGVKVVLGYFTTCS